MIELVLSYYLLSSHPLYLNQQAPYADKELRLIVSKEWAGRFYLNLEPYVWGKGDIMGRAGALAEIGVKGDRFRLGLVHESIHSLDVSGRPIELDGVRLRWRLQ